MKLKPVKAEKIIKVLSKLDFQIVRRKGSHVIMKHPDGRVTVIPVHKGEELGRGILREIIKDAKVNKEEFFEVIEKSIILKNLMHNSNLIYLSEKLNITTLKCCYE